MTQFQTLGNTVLYPRGGLLFIDYFRGHTLQVTGKMKLHFLKDQKHYYLDGRNRVVTFEIEKWIFRRKSCPFKWRLLKFSRYDDGDPFVPIILCSHKLIFTNSRIYIT